MAAAERGTQKFRRAGLAAAEWYVRSQRCMTRPYWDANHGRFIYNRYLPDGRTVWGLNWTQGRGIFVLLAAWELTGDERFLRSALLAGEYIKILQIHDCPRDPRRQFAIREQVPQSTHSAPRDATEAAIALLFLYRATGRDDYLRRALDYEKWFRTNAWGPDGWPRNMIDLSPAKRRRPGSAIQTAQAILFYYLHQATGNRRFLTCVRRLADQAMRRFLRADGAIVSGGRFSHHAGPGGVMLNDDGFMVALLCAHRATGHRRYLDACRRHAEWIARTVTGPLRLLCALPCMCTFLIELAAVTGDDGCRRWAADMLARHVLALQVRRPRDPMSHGAFRGEDEPVEHYGPKSAKKTDFITTRTTCYAALACLKLAGIVGPYYGALGWDRKVRRPRRLPDLAVQ